MSNMQSGWQWGSEVRIKVVPGQIQVKRTPNTGTTLVEAMCEVVTPGPMFGRRAPWTGWLNTPENVQDAIKQLRALGWKGQKLGDWSGLDGRRECAGTVMKDTRLGTDSKAHDYPRLAFLKALRVLNTENAVQADELDKLNAELGISEMTEAMVHDGEIPF